MRVKRTAVGIVIAALSAGCTAESRITERGSSPEPTFPQDLQAFRDKIVTFATGLAGPPDVAKRFCADLRLFAEATAAAGASATKAGINDGARKELGDAAAICSENPGKAARTLRVLAGSGP